MSAPVFSYAQAAKGRASTSQAAPNPASSASSDRSASRVSPAETSTKQDKADPTRNALPNLASNLTQSPVQSADDAASARDDVLNSSADSPQPLEIKDVKENSDSSPEVLSGNKRDPATTYAESAPLDKDKTKDTDDEWEKVSTPSSLPDKAESELKAAPPPPVNIWQQRKEAQAAKVASHRPPPQQPVPNSTPAAAQQKPTPAPTDENRRKSTKDQSGPDSTLPQARRVNSGARPTRDQDSSQVSPRSTSLQGEKTTTTYAGPSVSDAESWPTPETVTVDDKRRSSAIDKADRPDYSDAKPVPQKKQWTQIPFVPTVKWQTPVPAGRRGGRSAARGRGGSAAAGDRHDDKTESGSMAPPPVPKPHSEQDRGRKGAAAKSNRAASLPTEGGRDEAGAPAFAPPSTNQTSVDMAASSNSVALPTDTPASADASQSSSRQPSHAAITRRDRHEDDLPEPLPVMPAAQDSTQTLNKSNTTGDRPTRGDDLQNGRDLDREKAPGSSKEWARDRNSSSREKSETWRDRREPRPDRGRGSYRGRGNHAAYASTASGNHPYTAPLPQNGFEVSKPGQQEPRSRQSSQTFAQSSSFSSHRGNPRSQSIGVSMMAPPFYQSTPSFPHTMSPIQGDMPFSGYGQIPGIMDTMPYQQSLNAYGTMSMVATQLQYYFSVDNLCKDMYLRKHMDSEGYVPLRVVADFNRVKALLGEGSNALEQLRDVAQSVPTVEIMSGDGGEDRVRCRDKWQQFVLPIEERVANPRQQTGQTHPNGPTSSTQQPPNIRTDYSPLDGPLNSAPPQTNGFHDSFRSHMPFTQLPSFEPQNMEQWSNRPLNHSVEDEQRSSTTSPLEKVQSPGSESNRGAYGHVNGHRASHSIVTEPESPFTDEEVARLRIVVKDPEYQENETSQGAEEQPATGLTSLRGGAGSPEQLERRLAGLRFGQTAPLSAYGQPLYFTQHEQPPENLLHPSFVHEDYLTLRDKAAVQRTENHLGGAVAVLYTLWADFLPREGNFNVGMYEDFRDWALEDVRNGDYNGKNNLVQFYAKSLKVTKPVSHRVAYDIVQVARDEPRENRPTWQKLHAAWRDGATNVRSRKRILDLLTDQEKTELDR